MLVETEVKIPAKVKKVSFKVCDCCGENISKHNEGNTWLTLYKNGYVHYEGTGLDLCDKCAATLANIVSDVLYKNLVGFERYENDSASRLKLIELIRNADEKLVDDKYLK